MRIVVMRNSLFTIVIALILLLAVFAGAATAEDTDSSAGEEQSVQAVKSIRYTYKGTFDEFVQSVTAGEDWTEVYDSEGNEIGRISKISFDETNRVFYRYISAKELEQYGIDSVLYVNSIISRVTLTDGISLTFQEYETPEGSSPFYNVSYEELIEGNLGKPFEVSEDNWMADFSSVFPWDEEREENAEVGITPEEAYADFIVKGTKPDGTVVEMSISDIVKDADAALEELDQSDPEAAQELREFFDEVKRN